MIAPSDNLRHQRAGRPSQLARPPRPPSPSPTPAEPQLAATEPLPRRRYGTPRALISTGSESQISTALLSVQQHVALCRAVRPGERAARAKQAQAKQVHGRRGREQGIGRGAGAPLLELTASARCAPDGPFASRLPRGRQGRVGGAPRARDGGRPQQGSRRRDDSDSRPTRMAG